MEISKIVEKWCDQRNAKSKYSNFIPIYCIIAFFVATICALMYAGFSFEAMAVGIILFMVCFTVYITDYGKIVLRDLKTGRARFGFIDDSLLKMLADAHEVPESMKIRIACILKEDGGITYGKLFDLEELEEEKKNKRAAEQAAEQAAAARKQGEGYRKIISYMPKSRR